MNRCPLNLTLGKSIDGFLNYKLAEGLTQRSVSSYEWILRKWVEQRGDHLLTEVTSDDVRNYLAWLRTDYQPHRFNGKTHPLSAKTLRNIWITFSAFFGWAHTEFQLADPMDDVPAPRFQKTPVEPFTKEEVDKLLKACLYSREAKTVTRRAFVMRPAQAVRNQTIMLVLLDTGLRASELCALTIGDVDLKTGKVQVKHGLEGGAKGGKGRVVFLGKATRRAVWRYLTGREDGEDQKAPLFLNRGLRPFHADTLRILVTRIGRRAGVKDAHPHKFRHTFALTYLRSGGDVFTLQALLGHSTLDMVRHYARIAEVDVEEAHRKASPVDNWRL